MRNLLWKKKSPKTIGDSYFNPKNNQFLVWQSAIVNHTHNQGQKSFNNIDRKFNSFQTVIFFEKSSDLVELCIFLYNEF